MTVWVLLILLFWWVWKHPNHKNGASMRGGFFSAKKEITENFVQETQTKFEERLHDVFLPDAINGKEIYIYRNLMSVWYAKLSSEKHGDRDAIQKLRSDWILYMSALRDKSAGRYLTAEVPEKEGGESYKNDYETALKKVFDIEDAFSSAIGKETVDELARIRVLDDVSAFSKEGELVPEGFEINAEGKIQPKTKKGIKALFSKLFLRKK